MTSRIASQHQLATHLVKSRAALGSVRRDIVDPVNVIADTGREVPLSLLSAELADNRRNTY
jgi:hypothetical protein